MSGPITLRTEKGLLTRYCNNLNEIIAQYEGDVSQGDISPSSREFLEHIHTAILELKATSKLVADQLDAFVNVIEAMGDALSKDHEAQALEYIEKAHLAIDRAEKLAIKLEAKRISVRESGNQPIITRNTGQVDIAAPKLPAIPIPTFTGKIWDYANFWTLFNANVHSQPSLTNLQKFNLLINALKGEARELVRRYPVTEENYEPALHLLQKKYGNDAQLISALQSRLESARAENSTTQAQRKLLETIFPIVTQLGKLNIDLNGSYNAQKVLAKFALRIHRKVLERQITPDMVESQWKMEEIIAELDANITMEEHVNDMVSKSATVTTRTDNVGFPMRQGIRKLTPCIFCHSPMHKSALCTRYSTLEERRSFLQTNNMCLNCGREGHFVKDCTREGCRRCQGRKHNHVLCPQRMELGKHRNLPQNTSTMKTSAAPTMQKPAHAQQRTQGVKTRTTDRITQAHPIQICATDTEIQDQEKTPHEDEDPTVLQSTSTPFQHQDSENVLLLTGNARVWNANSKEWQFVEILFDTGADQSFINQALAEDLGLTCTEMKEFNMYTFGTRDPVPTTCGVTFLDLWDNKGEKHNVRLYATAVLTAKGKLTYLSQQDLDFIANNKIPLSRVTKRKESKPQILLGCDQLWNLLEVPSPRYTLPSGLLLIPSKLGYLLTGRQQMTATMDPQPSMVTMIQTLTNKEEDLQRWDRHWTMDSAGVCEFTGTKDAEKSAINDKVLQFFNDTIEKRDDGYYVRLPFKQDHPPLPTNKAIAFKRLESVLKMLKSNEQLSEDYDGTFKAQLDNGIIEEIPEEQGEGGVIHYIPHQPVITPHKETTKLRIFFDASSHFKDCPSLNDVLYQGPLILPELYAMLLRFRMPKYVITSDVEKAFLQVRLHELDRDATRFFWVRDYRKDPTEDNIFTYRFTRVTFGLNVSPFLLGATVHYHLRNANQDKELEREIRENLYVDNLILAAETKQEALRKSTDSRKIFADMGMNLREFLSNDHFISEGSPKKPAQLTEYRRSWESHGIAIRTE
ncbi:hypothetical protein Aduo_018638 [Ancylostoma duodenale]